MRLILPLLLAVLLPVAALAQTCGDSNCDDYDPYFEDQSNCCTDCGCPDGYFCLNNTCYQMPTCGMYGCETGESCFSCPGDCACSEGFYCDEATETCLEEPTPTPSCYPFCGGTNGGCNGQNDGCGGYCYSGCDAGYDCQYRWSDEAGTSGYFCTAQCVPDCTGKCGGASDGCGGWCGDCPMGQECVNYSCCTPNCNDGMGQRCDSYWDGCNNYCNNRPCPTGETCTGTYCAADTPTPVPTATPDCPSLCYDSMNGVYYCGWQYDYCWPGYCYDINPDCHLGTGGVCNGNGTCDPPTPIPTDTPLPPGGCGTLYVCGDSGGPTGLVAACIILSYTGSNEWSGTWPNGEYAAVPYIHLVGENNYWLFDNPGYWSVAKYEPTATDPTGTYDNNWNNYYWSPLQVGCNDYPPTPTPTDTPADTPTDTPADTPTDTPTSPPRHLPHNRGLMGQGISYPMPVEIPTPAQVMM